MDLPLVTGIQRYSIHDGKGIRTTVFFKGCPLSCRWCHNPETQRGAAGLLFYGERCVGCGACVRACRAVHLVNGKAVTDRGACMACGDCLDWCVHNAREICGTAYGIEELVREIRKDSAFYETSGGGVTLSGGEVLAQNMDYIELLMSRLKSWGIRINIDTCGAVPWERFARILPYTETFLYDIKFLNDKKHRAFTGCSNRQILENLVRLSGAGTNIWIRIPVIGTVNDSLDEIQAIGDWLQEKKIHPTQINLLPYHNTGASKYPRIGRTYEGMDFTVPSEPHMELLRRTMEAFGIAPVYTGG